MRHLHSWDAHRSYLSVEEESASDAERKSAKGFRAICAAAQVMERSWKPFTKRAEANVEICRSKTWT